MKWFSLSGIVEEARRVRWPKKDDMIDNFIIVIVFTIFFGICFYGSDALVALFLRLVGITGA